MKIKIAKAHGTQNTFIIIYDNHHHSLIKSQIKKICHQFDTDGLLLVSDDQNYDYKMDYLIMMDLGKQCVQMEQGVLHYLCGKKENVQKILSL